MRSFLQIIAAILLATGIAGCGSSDAKNAAAPHGSAANTAYVLAKEPAGAVTVSQVREKAQDNEEVVVLGRIGGPAEPWIEGAAAFLIIDPCTSESGHEGCGPDCACCAKEVAASATLVEFVDDQGQTLLTDSRELLGVKKSETIVVRGRARRDKWNNVSVLADGVYIRR